MDLVGHHQSARRFHDWAATAILRRADLVERAVAKAEAGSELRPGDVLHTRYGLDGEPVGTANGRTISSMGLEPCFGRWAIT